MNNIEIQQLDIRPQASIYGSFSRLNYDASFAIAEFVDNSTQSYYTNEKSMRFYKKFKVEIDIEYDPELKTLTIKDDAFGMEIEDFKRAIILGAKLEVPNGRNEFGMGLKTAASWFGNIWSVRSTQLGSENEYYTEVNIPKLDETNSNNVNIEISKVDKTKHGTIVKITQLTKKITPSKVKRMLGSIYRRDIQKEKVIIRYNGEILKFEPYKILNFRGHYWERRVEFSFNYEEKDYHIDGMVGIIAPGSYDKAGFALFRNNRVVIGGEGQNYKPNKIFVQPQSQISLKLIGEFNMDSFEINQAKDGLVWDGGLEDAFLDHLKTNISDYIEIAKMSTKDRTSEESIGEDASSVVERETRKGIENLLKKTTIIDEAASSEDLVEKYKLQQKEMDDDIETEEKKESLPRTYTLPLNNLETVKVNVIWQINKSDTPWLDYSETEEDSTYDIIININHPFFKPYSDEEDGKFKIILEHLALSIVLAEQKAAKYLDDDENVLPSTIRILMNDYLTKVSSK